ncbi:MAG: ATP synthase subunit I [Desulfobacteraceae bacterium]|nr:MAG: ATP synthase subunit I [Desulfobacteraceae bacterium]
MEWQRFHSILRMLNWLVLLCFSLASYFSMGPFWTTGVLLGGLIAIVNFTVLQHTVRRAFSPEGVHQGARFSIVGKYYLRLLALGVILYVLIAKEWIDPLGLAVGLSTVVLSIIGLGIGLALRIRTKEAI